MSEPTNPTQNPNLTAESAADKAARDSAVKQADAFFKNDIKEAPKGTPEDLFRKFGAKQAEDSQAHQTQIDEAKQAKRDAEENRPESEIKASSVDDEKKPGYIKSLKQTNEQLSKEAAELKAKVADYEKSKAEIEELRAKIDDSETKKQVEKLQKELELAIKEKQEREEALTTDLEQLRKANAFLNLPSDPVFKETYDAPIMQGYSEIKRILNDDPTYLTELQKAVAAYEKSLTTPDQGERARQLEIYKQTRLSIFENLDPLDQQDFSANINNLVYKIKNRNEALANWEVTKAQADEEKTRRATMTKSQIGKRWQDAFLQAKQSLEDSIKYPEDIAKIISSQKIDDDTTEDEMIAEAALRENSNYVPEQITRVLMQGAKFKKAKAYSFALEKENAELKETIKKMRGSSTGDGNIGSSSAGKATEVEERTPASLFAKFRNR